MLGGLTVLFFLPAAISTAHAGLAEIFFCITIAIALFTSPGWIDGYALGRGAGRVDGRSDAARASRRRRRSLIYTQILDRRDDAPHRRRPRDSRLPADVRPSGAADHWIAKIAIHFAHRVGALVVTLAIVATARAHLVSPSRSPRAAPAGRAARRARAVQVTLGALTVLSRRDIWINSFHVVCGALVLTTSLVLTLRSWRVRFATGVRLAVCATQPGRARDPPSGPRLAIRNQGARVKDARADVAPPLAVAGARRGRSATSSRSRSRG